MTEPIHLYAFQWRKWFAWCRRNALVEQYWCEISAGLAGHGIRVQHFVLHADPDTLRARIEGDTVLGPSTFRLGYLEPYAEAARTWLHDEAEVIDTTHLTPAQAALQIADATKS